MQQKYLPHFKFAPVMWKSAEASGKGSSIRT